VVFDLEGVSAGGVFSPSSSSMMGGQYVLRTCLSAGRRMGLDKKKSMPESIHSLTFDYTHVSRRNVGGRKKLTSSA
jgi:hypothetical protein